MEKVAATKNVVETKTYVWKSAVVIPHYLILEMGDAGIFETWEKSDDDKVRPDKMMESDDLRVAIMVSGGHQVLVPTNGRIVILENGDLVIEVLVEE